MGSEGQEIQVDSLTSRRFQSLKPFLTAKSFAE